MTLRILTASLLICWLLAHNYSAHGAAAPDLSIKDIWVVGITHRIVTITWDTTVESTTQVIYGPTIRYGQTAAAPGMTTKHEVIIAGLDSDSTYHFRAISVAADGITVSSEDQTFTTTTTPGVPSAFPADFHPPVDATTRLPLLGFGGGVGKLYHDPIIFVHGNNESARYWLGQSYAFGRLFGNFVESVSIPGGGDIQAENIIERFIQEGYTPAEVWAVSYLGRDGINNFSDFMGSSFGHSHAANTGDVGAFIESVLAYTGAQKVDIIAHSLGVTLVREWIRQQLEQGVDVLSQLDDVVFIAGANHGVHYCGPPFVRGTEPPSSLTLCEEVGRADSPFLKALNVDETPRSNNRPDYLTILAVGATEDSAYPSAGVDGVSRMVNLRLSPILNGAVNIGLALSLPADSRFPVILPGPPPLDLGDPRMHYLLGTSEQAFQIMLPFVSNPREQYANSTGQ